MPAVLRKSIETPFGRMLLVQEGECLMRFGWRDAPAADRSPLLAEAAEQLKAYFGGALRTFDLPLAYGCSEFQAAACDVMARIPYGSTITYTDMARQLGTTPRAAGGACGGNPFPVIVPCHRVLAARGVGGYSGGAGIETKIGLLRLENAVPWLI